MRTKIYVTLAILISTTVILACRQGQTATGDQMSPVGTPTSVPVAASPTATSLDGQTRDALTAALADERRAHATYEAVVTKFGEIRPFSNIVNAERRHESFLLPLFEKYGIAVPSNEFTKERLVVPDSLQAACREAVAGEERNIAMYDKFLGFTKEHDIRETFTYLRDASEKNHLPAFQRCSQRGGRGS